MELFRYPLILAWGAGVMAALLFFRFKAEEARLAAGRAILGPSFDRLNDGPAAARRRLRGALFITAVGLCLLAAAGPQWGVELKPVTDLKGNVVIAVDTSLSMGARDLKPNRLSNARLLLSALAEKFADYRIGVVAFAGEAFVQCPLTTDQDAISYFASSLTPGMLSEQGTDFSNAIDTVQGMLARYTGQKVMVLITDGEDHSTGLDTVLDQAAAQNLRVFTIGIGSPDGELVPVADSSGNTMEYKKDRNGKTVVSRLDDATLMRIASRTGAAYIHYSNPDSAAEEVRQAVARIDMEKTKGKGHSGYKARYQWPLAAALALLLIEFMLMEKGFSLPSFRLKPRWPWRRPAALLLVLALGAGTAHAAGARAAARKGNSAYDRQDWSKAYENYARAMEKDPSDKRLNFNTGDAFYRLEDYAKAREFFEQAAADPALAAKAEFNRGNALYKAGDTKGAIEAYRRALTLKPGDRNARFNLQKALEKQEQDKKNQSKNKCDKNSDENKDKNKQNKDQDKQNGGGGGGDDKNGKSGQDDKDKDKNGGGGQDQQDEKEKQKQKEEEQKREQERKQAEARERSRQILEMMKEREKAASRGQEGQMQRAAMNKGKPQSASRMEDW